ncbi:MAG: hypothetical protein EFT35_06680 [Methanophagales archaeon ANME-1-THS]|nr:MAG: hypothetical protein EFT35_06680 [Methanophagales archaeon ANME-1-THS]
MLNPDYHLLLNICYGPWIPKIQKDVWRRAYAKFQSIGDIRKLEDEDISNLDLRFSWQRERIKKMRDYLRKESISFRDFLTRLKGLNGIEMRDKFREIMGGSSTKVYSTFIRDFMEKDDVFPIDSRVYSMRNKLGLPKDEKIMIKLCRDLEISPSLFEGFLYRFKEEFCDKNKYAECPIRDECWCSKIEKYCCKI